MAGYMSHTLYVAVKNEESKAVLKIVVNMNSLQVPALRSIGLSVLITEKYTTCIFLKEKHDEN